MPKSRKRTKVKNRKVYTHQRERKQGSATKVNEFQDQYKGVIYHSKEIYLLKIARARTKGVIGVYARSSYDMSHIIKELKLHIEYVDNRIQEHASICHTKMKLFLGKNAEGLLIPETFHLGSTDLENGYVSLPNEKDELMTVIMADTSAEFPNDLIKIGTIIPHDEEKLKDLKIESLLKNKDVISTILSQKASALEDKSQRQWLCYNASCLDRKNEKPQV
jgi:hypothetical protein